MACCITGREDTSNPWWGVSFAKLYLSRSSAGIDRVALEVGEAPSDVRPMPSPAGIPRRWPQDQACIDAAKVWNWPRGDEDHRLSRGVVLCGLDRHRFHAGPAVPDGHVFHRVV